MALAKNTSVLREAMLLSFEPRRLGASKCVPRTVCGHILKPCETVNCLSGYLYYILYTRKVATITSLTVLEIYSAKNIYSS